MKIEEGGNFLGYDSSKGKPYLKYKTFDSVPEAYKRVAKEHIPQKGVNMNVPHWRVFVDEMDVVYKGIRRKDGEFGPQYNMSVVDIETENEYIIPFPAYDLACLKLLFAAVQAGPEFKMSFGKYPKVTVDGEIVNPPCEYLLYDVDKKVYVENPDFDKEVGSVWRSVCNFIFGAKGGEATAEIKVPYKERKLIQSRAGEFFKAFSIKLSEYFDTLIANQPKVEEPIVEPAVADEDLPF